MKKIPLLLLFFLLANFIAVSQELEYTITFMGEDGKPLASTVITCTEVESREVMKQTTNHEGTAIFKFTKGKLWQMEVLKIKNYYMWQIKMPKAGTAKRSQTITYSYKDYLFAMRPPVDRSKIKFKIINQKLKSGVKPEGESIMKIVMTKPDRKTPLRKLPIQLTCYALEKQYRAVTNSKGVAYFKIPLGNEYEVDIEGINGYDFVKISNKGARTYTNKYTFAPINFTETIKNNIVTQALAENQKPTSARCLLHVYFRNSNGKSMGNKAFEISELEGELTYRATTNAEGEALFMLPKKKTYIYKYKNQGPFKNYDIVADLTRAQGIGQGGKMLKIRQNLIARATKLKLELPQNDKEVYAFFKSKNFKISNFTNKSIPYYAQPYMFFKDKQKTIGMDKGLLMTTGRAINALGANDDAAKTGANAYYFYSDVPVALLNTSPAYDPCVIEFDITPTKKTRKITFDFIFASEEYPEFTHFDDAFGAFISGGSFDEDYNFANFSDTARLSVSYINHKNNKDYYISNLDNTKNTFKTWQYDGFTKKMSKELMVVPGKTYHIKFIIFDRIDNIYDSVAFINIR